MLVPVQANVKKARLASGLRALPRPRHLLQFRLLPTEYLDSSSLSLLAHSPCFELLIRYGVEIKLCDDFRCSRVPSDLRN